MKNPLHNFSRIITLTAGLALAFTPAHADIFNLFSGTGDIGGFATNGTPPASGAAEIDGSGTIGSGTALRVWDLDTTDKGEAIISLATPITTGGFRLQFTAYNVTVSGSNALRLRFANAGTSLGTEGNTATSISHETDGDLTYKYDNGAGGRTTDKVTPGLDIAHTVGIVFNTENLGGSNLIFDLGAGNLTLAPQEYAFYVNGSLVASNLPATLSASSGYNPALGIGEFGWLGSSDSGSGIDVYLDDIMLYTGADISVPEPKTVASILGLTVLALVMIRRRFSAKR